MALTQAQLPTHPAAAADAPRDDLREALEHLRIRWLHIGLLTLTVWFAVVVGGTLVIALGVDSMTDLSPSARSAAIVASVASGCAWTIWIAWQARHAARADALAQRIDAQFDRVGRVRAGVDLMSRASSSPPLTQSLAALAIAQAARDARAMSPRDFISAQPALRPVRWLAAGIVCIVMIACLAPRLVGTQVLRFADPHGDHPPFSRITFTLQPGTTTVDYGGDVALIASAVGGDVEAMDLVTRSESNDEHAISMFRRSDGTWGATLHHVEGPQSYFVRSGTSRSKYAELRVRTLPRIERIECTITPPAYTGAPPYSGAVPKDGIRGVAGTRVTLHVVSNRPLRSGSMQFEGVAGVAHTSLEVSPADQTSAAGAFAITSSGALTLSLTDADGQSTSDSSAVSITLIDDRSPSANIAQPINPSYATPDATIPVQVRADDDFGIANLRLLRSLNGSRPLPLDVALDGGARTHAEAAVPLRLAPLGLRQGDVITLAIAATDNDARGGKTMISPATTVRIVSKDEFDRRLLARDGFDAVQARYDAVQAQLTSASDDLHHLQHSTTASTTAPNGAGAAAIAERLQAQSVVLAAAAERPLPIDLDRALLPSIAKAAARVSAVAQRLAASGTQPTNDQLAAVAAADQELAAANAEFHEQAESHITRFAMLATFTSLQHSIANTARFATAGLATTPKAAAVTNEAILGQITAWLEADATLARATGNTIQQLRRISSSSDSEGENDGKRVGLYAVDMPGSRSPASSGSGDHADHGVARDDSGGSMTSAVQAFQQRLNLKAGGAADVAVPAAYRERVDAYFRRVVDELSGDGR